MSSNWDPNGQYKPEPDAAQPSGSFPFLQYVPAEHLAEGELRPVPVQIQPGGQGKQNLSSVALS